MEILNKILDEEYKRTNGIVLVISIVFFSIMPYINFADNRIKNYLMVIVGIIDSVYIIYCHHINNSLPKSKDLQHSILLILHTQDKKSYDDLEFKFSEEIGKNLSLGDYRFKIYNVKFNLCKKYKVITPEIGKKLLEETNCMFLIEVKEESEELKQTEDRYVMKINFGIIHPHYQERIEQMYKSEIYKLGQPILEKSFYKNERIAILNSTAYHLSTVAQYIVGRSCWLIGDIDAAMQIAEDIKKVETTDYNLKKAINGLYFDSYIITIIRELNAIKPKYDIIEVQLDSIREYIYDSAFYYAVKSICAFKNRRDINTVLSYLGRWKKIQARDSWMYSEAFIWAYTNKSEGKIWYGYKKAFKMNYDLEFLIGFIEEILEEEPDKNMLRFALMILYIKEENFGAAKTLLQDYIVNKGKGLEDTTIKNLEVYFGKDIMIKILM